MSNSEEMVNLASKQVYQKPELVVYGTVKAVTQQARPRNTPTPTPKKDKDKCDPDDKKKKRSSCS